MILLISLLLLLLIYIYVDNTESFDVLSQTAISKAIKSTPILTQSNSSSITQTVLDPSTAMQNLSQIAGQLLKGGVTVPGNLSIYGNINVNGTVSGGNFKTSPVVAKDYNADGSSIYPATVYDTATDISTGLPVGYNGSYNIIQNNIIMCPPGSIMTGIKTEFNDSINQQQDTAGPIMKAVSGPDISNSVTKAVGGMGINTSNNSGIRTTKSTIRIICSKLG
jgi:hypothetical protein